SARRAFPFRSLKQPYISKTNFLNSGLTITYQPVKGLNFSTNIGYNDAQANQQKYYYIASFDPLTNPVGGNFFGYNSNKNWIIEPQITYDAIIGKGKLNLLLGSTVQDNRTIGSYAAGGGYSSDNLIKSLANATTWSAYDNQGEYRYAAIFGRVTYNWKNKYIL